MKTKHDIARYFEDDHPLVLDEASYQEIFAHINPNDLPHRDYAPLIPFVKYVGTKGDIMKFFVPNKYNGYNNFIQFPEWQAQVDDKSLNPNEAARLILWGNKSCLLHCQCPAYKFYGMQYILTQLDSAIVPEVRFPRIRNPQLMGICCKHLRRTLKVLPFHLGQMAAAIKQQRQNG